MSARRMRTALALAAVAALGLAAAQVAFAAFSSQTGSPGNVVSAASDFRPPQVTATAIAKASGGAAGFVKQGGAYFAYANVAADTGNPASGIATVSADVRALTTAAAAIPLSAGSYEVDGTVYGYRSNSLSADPVLGEGAKAFTVTATDNALNAASANGTAQVDNTPPAAADVQTTNAGANGFAELGDTLRLTFSEPVEAQSIFAGWNGTATNVVVRINDNGLLGLPLGNDVVQVFNAANATLLPLGTVDLGRGDYVSGLLNGNVRFGAIGGTGTPSTMALSGSTVVLTLGTYNSTFLVDPVRGTAGGNGTATWASSATPHDRAANAAATATATESGAADREF